MLVTLDTLTLRGADGDSVPEKFTIIILVLMYMCLENDSTLCTDMLVTLDTLNLFFVVF